MEMVSQIKGEMGFCREWDTRLRGISTGWEITEIKGLCPGEQFHQALTAK